MASAYPGALDNLTNPDGTGTLAEEGATGDAHHTLHADERDAIDAIQAELGVDPAGLYPTVVARLEALDDVVVYTSGSFVPASTGDKFPGRPQILSAVIAGGAAGDHTVTGIGTLDDLVSVIEFDTGVPADLTDEFTISDADEINNTGGTDTSGNTLLVHYSRSRGYDLTGLAFPTNEDTKAAMTLWVPATWNTVTIGAVVLASSFGTGTVRWYHSGDPGTAVDVEVVAAYVGTLFSDLTLGAGSGAMAGFKSYSLSLTRMGTHANDDLAEAAVPVAIYAVPGA